MSGPPTDGARWRVVPLPPLAPQTKRLTVYGIWSRVLAFVAVLTLCWLCALGLGACAIDVGNDAFKRSPYHNGTVFDERR